MPRDGGNLGSSTGNYMRAARSSIQSPIRSSIRSLTRLLFVLAGMAVGICWGGNDAGPLPSSITTAPLSVDQVVNNLVRRDAERAKALRHYESTRFTAFPIAASRVIATPK